MPSETRIRCFVDFERAGKQVAHLQLPHSSNLSAYGWIGIPICVVKNGRGPTLYPAPATTATSTRARSRSPA
ncbi:MAG TPA: hypothetical protein VFY19_09390 [Geminicoccaceae bacterium]|nr:hypothetical protein [Geminicoccaceae bacterium]